ncbi:phosphopantetheine-binding protein, partial [Vibrio tasmaniensis]|uniref:phosphopantetheine-binding protein n=4 Tax=Vibrionaceae TaxID=641 RepID=UPI001112CCA9
CRTLGEIVAYMNSKLPTSAPVIAQTAATSVQAASGLDAAVVQKTMLEVVAEKTGYPTEMLDLAMDMEADLGIDSIKRVEILGTVQDELPTLPELNPEDLAECRTLGEIVAYMNTKSMNSKLPVSAPVATQASAPVQAVSNGLNAEQVQSTMLSVVADKTGYPTEMLDLAMDMEADLGID